MPLPFDALLISSSLFKVKLQNSLMKFRALRSETQLQLACAALTATARMEESKSGPYGLQQAVSLFMARKVGLLTVKMALERSPESVKGLSCTVRRSRGEWTRLKRLHDSRVGSTLFSRMTVSGKVLACDGFWDVPVHVNFVEAGRVGGRTHPDA